MATKSKSSTKSGRKTVAIGGKNYKAGSKRANEAVSAGGTISKNSSQIQSNRDSLKARTAARSASDPLTVAANMGIETPDRIEKEEMPGVVADLAKKGAIPTQVQNKAQVQAPGGPEMPQDVISDPVTGNTYSKGANGLYSPYQEGFQKAISSGATPPTTAGTAAVSQYMPPAPADTAAVDQVFSEDPVVNQLMQGAWQMLNPQKQTQTLMQDYKRLRKDSGLDEINEELIDAETVINGSEEDIRNEIQSSGGFGTESQVQSMALARNKSLLTRYNQLAQMKTDAQNQLNTMMTLSQQDRQMAQERINTQVTAMFNMANFRQQAQNNIKEQYRWLTTTMGVDGVYDAYKNDPRQLAFLENNLGVAPGGLASLASKAAQSRALETQMKQAQLAAQYSSIETDKLQQAKLRQEMTPQSTELKTAQSQSNIQNISALASDKSLSGAVGANIFGRLDPLSFFTGGKQNFIGGVEQLREQLTLDKLSQAKQNGATFGALSDGERVTVAAAATKLGSWAQKDKSGKTIGYNIDEGSFKKELDKINNFAKLDAIINGADPKSVGVQQTGDGAYWTRNSDGSMTRLR